MAIKTAVCVCAHVGDIDQACNHGGLGRQLLPKNLFSAPKI